MVEAAPMVVLTYWLNMRRSARLLPVELKQYLDLDGQTERICTGWIDKRSDWKTFADPFAIALRDTVCRRWQSFGTDLRSGLHARIPLRWGCYLIEVKASGIELTNL